MGPESAGADPGPVRHDRGGQQPTITDANLVLGRLGSELVRGELPLNRDKAYTAIEQHIARPLNLSVETAAHGMLEILHNNMMGATGPSLLSVATIRANLPSCLWWCRTAARWLPGRLLGIPTVIIPRYAGVLSTLRPLE